MEEIRRSAYNPFNDPTLHATHQEEEIPPDDREAFNSVLKHNDIVTGGRLPKSMNGYPPAVRFIVRWFAILSVGSLLIALTAQLIRSL
jgi:hypothetical protein